MSTLPPLALHTEIDTADGQAQYRWDADARAPEDRPQGISCGSTLMNGYASGTASLARNINREYPDLGLYDTIRFVGVDGQIAYEGRGSRFPREASTNHRINAESVGWMSHARDKPILFLGIDGRLGSWGSPTTALDNILRAAGYSPQGPGDNQWDALSMKWTGPWVAGELPICIAVFDAGPQQYVGSVYYSSTPGLNVGDVSNYDWRVNASPDRELSVSQTSGNLQGATANSGTLTVTATNYRYAAVQFAAVVTGAGTDGINFNVDWSRLVVYGRHGLPLVGTAAPFGLLGSDIIRYTAGIAAPLLDTSGVQATTHPIEQFVFNDGPTDVYDMWLAANQYERWNLAVWENRKLIYAPLPEPTTAQPDWVLRSDHPNNLRRGYDGPSVDSSKNGVIVRYQNILTGAADMIDPTTDATLADTDTRLPSNRAGIQDWAAIQLPNPNSPTGAAKIGRAALAEYNRQRTPSRFNVMGYIADTSANWHQGWMVRAGETVLLEEDENDPVRVIHEVSWNQDTRDLTINADASSRTLDAIIADMGV